MMTMQQIENDMRAAGFSVSVCSWEDDDCIYVCSKETCGRGTFHRPRAEAQFFKTTGNYRKNF